jgi:NAD(P)-dependent dehydrogenase (short-subunit alcohol dehydrogenase family)
MSERHDATAVALVTGASAGIGAATARQLLTDGYTVYAAARRVEKMQQLAAVGARVLEMDVTIDAQMVAGIERIIEECGRIDVLVSNAGYGSYGAIEDVPLNEGRYQFEVNLFGLARLIQLALPHMRGRRSGKIVNVSSMGGKIYEPLGGWYHATKFAVEGLSDCLRLELAEFGIDVIVIQPGGIKTAWGDIAADHLLAVSSNTAYARQAERQARLLRYSESDMPLSEPEVVARTVCQAIKARRPYPRYATGYMAKPMLFLRKWVSDRAFDWIMETSARRIAKR